MIEFASFVIFIALFFISIVKNIQSSIRLSSISKELIQSYIERTILAEKLIEESTKSAFKKDTESEAFLKFISDSRDWAYEYIEDVQLKLKTFLDDVGPEIQYFDEYGVVGDAYPHYYSMKKISMAYKELETLLPEDYDRIEE